MADELVGNLEWPGRASLSRALSERHDTVVNRWARWSVSVQVLSAGQAVFEEVIEGKRFRIEVIHPDQQVWREFPIENAGLALRVVYGDFAMLLGGTLHYEAQRDVARRHNHDALAAHIITTPHHGAALPGGNDRPQRAEVLRALERGAGPLLETVQPKLAIMEFGSPRPVLGDAGRTASGVYDITRQFYADQLGEDNLLSTDRDLAIMIYSDGVTFEVETQAQRHRAQGGETDAVSDLSIGF